MTQAFEPATRHVQRGVQKNFERLQGHKPLPDSREHLPQQEQFTIYDTNSLDEVINPHVTNLGLRFQ